MFYVLNQHQRTFILRMLKNRLVAIGISKFFMRYLFL